MSNKVDPKTINSENQRVDGSTENAKIVYDVELTSLVENMKTLPPNELVYHMALLISSIQNEPHPEEHTLLLRNGNELITSLKQFYEHPEAASDNLIKVNQALNALIDASEMQTISQKVKKALLGVCSVILGSVISITAGFVGLAAGFFTDYNFIGNFRGAYLGWATGFGLGAYIGSRIPDVLSQSDFERAVEFSIKNIAKVGGELNSKKTYDEYYQETKQYILNVFFKNVPEDQREKAYKDFLLSDDQEFEVCTTTAGFIHKQLKGYVGHHFLIRFKINGVQDVPMEFGDRVKTPGFVNQFETPRKISGKKLVDMLVLDRILQHTHTYTNGFMLKDFDLASNDCRTYVDKLLIGTKQPPTQVPRFDQKNDNWIGLNIVAPTVRFFSKTQEKTALAPFIDYYKDGNSPEIKSLKWHGVKAAPGSTTDPAHETEEEDGRFGCLPFLI